ncbi:hypothetical protein HU200_048848 [Digitaria exilis]|uniref:Uncharacterized protein n=1 Tax=Digitaria exilis TaxID=1010633 RepID=A0A835AUB4_9POAL|nr:hypothetical protein HU200_048848 [Digitaria exilis]
MEISEACTERNPNKTPTTGEILRLLDEAEAGEYSVVTTPAVEWIGSLSRLMDSMQLMVVTSPQQPSSRAEEGSKALKARASQLAWPKRQGETSTDKVSSIRLYGERTVSTNKVSVDPGARKMAGVAYPVTRGDGWMELKLQSLPLTRSFLARRR